MRGGRVDARTDDDAQGSGRQRVDGGALGREASGGRRLRGGGGNPGDGLLPPQPRPRDMEEVRTVHVLRHGAGVRRHRRSGRRHPRTAQVRRRAPRPNPAGRRNGDRFSGLRRRVRNSPALRRRQDAGRGHRIRLRTSGTHRAGIPHRGRRRMRHGHGELASAGAVPARHRRVPRSQESGRRPRPRASFVVDPEASFDGHRRAVRRPSRRSARVSLSSCTIRWRRT